MGYTGSSGRVGVRSLYLMINILAEILNTKTTINPEEEGGLQRESYTIYRLKNWPN